jgi:hypothetical protein
MLTFLILSLFLFGAIRQYPSLEQRFVDPSIRVLARQLYYLNILSVYLTVLISGSFYIMHYLGWLSSILLIYGYFPCLHDMLNY